MPHLNWREEPPTQSVQPNDRFENVLRLAVPHRKRLELLERLESVLAESGDGELRWDLPGSWILFFKRRPSESRLLLAHPESQVWVLTVALEPAHAAALLSAVRAHCDQAGETSLRALGVFGRVSNCDLILEWRDSA